MNAAAAAEAKKAPPALKSVPEAAPQVEAERKAPVLKVGDLRFAEFMQTDRAGVAPLGSRPEDFHGEPDAWAFMSDLKPYDLVRLVARDATWWALYLCVDAEIGHVNCIQLLAVDLPPRRRAANGGLSAGYDVKAGDPGDEPWQVVRVADGFVLNQGQGHTTYEAARRFLVEHPIFKTDKPVMY